MTALVATDAARKLILAALATALLVSASMALRLVNPMNLPGPSVSALVPLLWGAGAVIVLVLTRSWAPAVAWGAAIVGSTAAALAVIGVGWEARAIGIQPGRWLDLAMFAALVIPAAIAGAYATADPRTPAVSRGRGVGCGRGAVHRPRWTLGGSRDLGRAGGRRFPSGCGSP